MVLVCRKALEVHSLLLILALFGFDQHRAQAQESLLPKAEQEIWRRIEPPQPLLMELRTQYVADLERIELEDRRLTKAVAEDWKELQEDLLKNLNDKHFVFGTPINTLLDSIVAVLHAADPSYGKPPRVLLSWYPWPNASCRGEGTIVVDLGLLERLHSRSELAFVLAHEMAHQRLDHVGKSIEQYNRQLLSDDFRSEVRSALRAEFNRRAALEQLFVQFTVGERRHGRMHESEADSMALMLIDRTGFQPEAGLSLMDVLESCDNEVDTTLIDPKWAFGIDGVDTTAFREHKDQMSSLGALDLKDRTLADSLKTHPDCANRKAALLELMAGEVQPSVASVEPAYVAYQAQASTSLIESAFIERDLGRAIYLGLQLLRSRADTLFLHAQLARGYAELYRASKQHEFGHAVANPAQYYSSSYNGFLQVLHQLRQSEYMALSQYHQRLSKLDGFEREDTLLAAAILALANKAPVELEEARAAYIRSFPAGRHITRVEKFTLIGPGKR